MTDPTSLKEAFQGLIPSQAALLIGTVRSASPLRIEIANDSKLVITAAITVVPRHLTNHTVPISISGGTVSGRTGSASDHSHSLSSFSLSGATLTINNALKVGDRVHVLALQNGKKYYVLDRV